SLPREEVINGVKVIRLKPTVTWSHGSYSPELPQVIKALKPDIVHVHVWRHPHTFQIAKLRRDMGFKAILHGHAPFYKLSQLGFFAWTYHRLVDLFGKNHIRAYDVYIALTMFESKIIVDMGIDKDKIVTIPNGINDECNVDFDSKIENQILYLGRISKSKNLTLLVKSLKYVVKEARKIKLVLAGPDEGLVEKLINNAKKQGVDIQYMSEVGEKIKHKLYLESSIYALSSLYEGFGLTLLEAGIHGTPSVITGSGGQIEAAPPGLASLWAEPRPEKFGEAIFTLLTNDDLRKRLGTQAREWARKHLWSKILPSYEKLYNKI
ncbi:MAG: glycosyltransferase family 4 protein, partial [Infirmifilum sp.]